MSEQKNTPAPQPLKHYLVSGIVLGDNDESAYVYQNVSKEEAVRRFKQDLRGDSNIAPEDQDDPSCEIFISAIAESDTPIRLVSEPQEDEVP